MHFRYLRVWLLLRTDRDLQQDACSTATCKQCQQRIQVFEVEEGRGGRQKKTEDFVVLHSKSSGVGWDGRYLNVED